MNNNKQFALILVTLILCIWVLVLYNIPCESVPFRFAMGFVFTFIACIPFHGADKHAICVIISIASNYLWLSFYIWLMVNGICGPELHYVWNKLLCLGLTSLGITLLM